VPRLPRLLALCGLLSMLLAGCTGKNAVSDGSGGPQQETVAQAHVNTLLAAADRVPAPSLHGRSLTGADMDLASMRGKVVVVNFWASWCSPCRAESPYLAKVAKDTAALGVDFVGVNIKDELGPARRFVDVHDVPYPSIFDQPGISLTRLHRLIPQTPPSTLLIDKDGRIAALFVGGVTESELSPPVRALAAEQA